MFETGIGKETVIQLASRSEFTMPADISATTRYFKQDVLIEPIDVHDGMIVVSNRPGIGWNVDTAALQALTRESIAVER
jgi:O-succinylbenzoate synthase